ncbi:hypothetical protein GSI_11978 [Ganoderma sinense ZZ0214-1]|uniref:Pseudouridine synthase RsuA/RluA-like domain-containing protein n=1 Tax=Ganoderma sinense ZZ0214-1 TaxID=1077348 RepID=A0A2G8RXI3_9APHY|nr:hypothetical protein GSI_11978 [Ganoderma sinense ZZ0214-1]
MASLPRSVPKPPHASRSTVSRTASGVPTAVSETAPSVPTTSTTTPPAPRYRLPADKLLLYADRGLVIVNKPNGLISQLSDPQNKETEPTVDAQIFSTFLEELRDKLGLNEPLRTLHRLDKPTTGALAFACNRQIARDFWNQMSGKLVKKTYLALVVGDAPTFVKKHGVIETKLECRNGWVRIPGVKDVYERDRNLLPSSRRRGEHWVRDAVTEYEVLATSPKVPLSLLRLHLHTGLKHQLRAHLAQALRAPILGDALYLDPRLPQLRTIKAAIDLPRSMFLHSSRLSLNRYCPSRVTLTVGAPLSASFVSVCEQAGIPLDRDDLLGGVWLDGTKALGLDAAPDGDAALGLERLGGKWYWRKRL